jgi:PAS domain S-box-containing protein
MSQANGATAGRHSRWVQMWREAVCAGAAGMMLVDLSAGRFLELSSRAAELIGRPRDSVAGLDYLAVVDDAQRAAETFRLVAEGVIDGLSARRRFLRADSSWVEVQVTGWAIRATGAGRALAQRRQPGLPHSGHRRGAV